MATFSFKAMRSVQLKIALISGACLVGTSIALIGYSLVSTRSTMQYAGSEVSQLVDRQTKESLLNRAASEAKAIGSELELGLDAARTMAQSFAVLAGSNTAATPSEARRAQFNAVLRNVVALNPTFNGTYSAWEPNGLDNSDAAFKGRADLGSDGTGRFLPYWTRDAKGSIAVQPLVEYESADRHPNGLVKGAWYLNPRGTGKENILGPLPYIVQGQQVFLATMSVPIMIDGKFRGVAGADYNLDFVQKLAQQIDASIFEGKGEVLIVNDAGLTVANSADAELIGKSAGSGDPRWNEAIANIGAGKAMVQDDAQSPNVVVYSPIKIGRTGAAWAVVISVPRAVVMAGVRQLDETLASRAAVTTYWQLGVGVTIISIAIFLISLAAASIARPTKRCAEFASGISKGDFEQKLDIEQADEVGVLAAALRNMQDDLKRRVAQRIEDQAAADTLRRDTMNKLAFEASVGEIVETVSSSSTQMEASANTLTATAERSQELATAVAAASEEASTNVQSVASATEEMSSSVTEISRQVQESARIAGEAVDQARNTNDRVGELSQAASRIGDVVELINTIAGQTNLLALNATIEAARAGEAGRGFAVVASEVKALAEQTAKATGEISQQITGIQAATQGSVAAIKQISTTIGRMSEISSTIASAVEEQGAATQEISRNVQQAAQGTMQVSSNITDVERGASETGSASSQVLSAAQSLSRDSNRLKLEVGKFLDSVRAA
ncbi:MAG TPA: methyl-accepting chemotaxis protein [Rhodopseudomonas sp.]|uniref:methyl-accepting chemotaxis protein n=1 Tax=Rhodopseudomonas sp. TaxID=1078 RepID=UPI002ED9CFE9